MRKSLAKKVFVVGIFMAFVFALVLAAAPPTMAGGQVASKAAQKVVQTVVVQGAGIIADIPGVFVRGGDKVNLEYAAWYAEIMSDASARYKADLVFALYGTKGYAGYMATVVQVERQYNMSKKTTVAQRLRNQRLRDQKMAIAKAYFIGGVEAAKGRNAFFPKLSYTTPQMYAEVGWGAIKGGLNYDWQVFDRLVGTAKNVVTAPVNDKDYAPGLWQTGSVSSYMWESDLANVLKLGGVITGAVLPYQAGGVVLYGLHRGSGAAAAAMVGTLGHGSQLLTVAAEEAWRAFLAR